MLHIVCWTTTDILKNVVLQLKCQNTLEFSAAMYQLLRRIFPEDLNSLTSLWEPQISQARDWRFAVSKPLLNLKELWKS